MLVKVRAKEGRVVNTAPRGGKPITSDPAGQLVEKTAWIDRAINVHGDLEIVPEPVAKKSVADKSADTTTTN